MSKLIIVSNMTYTSLATCILLYTVDFPKASHHLALLPFLVSIDLVVACYLLPSLRASSWKLVQKVRTIFPPGSAASSSHAVSIRSVGSVSGRENYPFGYAQAVLESDPGPWEFKHIGRRFGSTLDNYPNTLSVSSSETAVS